MATVGSRGGGKVIDFAFRLGLSYGLKEIRLTVVSVCVIPFAAALYLYSAFMPFDIMKLFFNGGMSAFARKSQHPQCRFHD